LKGFSSTLQSPLFFGVFFFFVLISYTYPVVSVTELSTVAFILPDNLSMPDPAACVITGALMEVQQEASQVRTMDSLLRFIAG